MNKHKKYKIKAQNEALYCFPDSQKCSVTCCENIGERHHIDYAYPKEIILLCRKHHKRLHYPTKYCDRDGCDNVSHAGGVCNKHYMRLLRAQTNCPRIQF